METQLDNQRLSPGQEVYLVHTPQFPGHFKVNPLLDLNLIPELQGPVYLLKDNTGGLSSLFVRNKHPIRFTLNLHKKGFTPGEHIHFTLDVNNSSSRPITSITVKLTQVKLLHKKLNRKTFISNSSSKGGNIILTTFSFYNEAIIFKNNPF